LDLIKKVLTTFLIYWFCLSAVYLLSDKSNPISNITAVSFGIGIVLLSGNLILDFLKLPRKNVSAQFGVIFVLTFIFTYIMKPGILGIIYYPAQLEISSEFIIPILNEFGIILSISLIATIVYIILNWKEK
jgi:hypothetical protein